MKYRIISLISIFTLLIALALGVPGMNIDDVNDRDRSGSAAVDTYAEAVGQDGAEAVSEEDKDKEDDADNTDSDASTDGSDKTDPDQTDPKTDGDTTEQTETDPQSVNDDGSTDQQKADDTTVADDKKDDSGSKETAESTGASTTGQVTPQPTPRPEKKAEKPAIKKKTPIDTKKTDSKTDAAPKHLDLAISDQDRAAVLNTPNSPIDASEVSGSRARADGKYEAYLENEYDVVFSEDFALIMEEIENAFELKQGLISEKAYKQRAENLEKGVVFGLDESSARAKPETENEMLVFTDEEVDLYSDEANESPDVDGRELIATYHYTNWADILAVYIIRQKQAGADKVLLNDHAKDALAQLFAEMNEVEITDEENLVAQFNCRTAEDVMSERAEDDPVREEIARYLDPSFITVCAAQSGSRQLMLAGIRASEEAQAAAAAEAGEEMTPLDARRTAVILAAQTLNGKIHYFWGGKYNNLGWNKYWATLKPVTSAGSRDTGTYQMYGLDCSGFVSWSFINGFDSKEADMWLGQGTASQWATSEPVSDGEARIGDLVFLRAPSAGGINHVGILIGRDADGNWLAIHCNGSDDNVSVDRAYDAGFRYIRRPVIYED